MSRYQTPSVLLQAVIGILLLFTGISIYLLFRSETITLYRWFVAAGMQETLVTLREGVSDWNIPSFVRFSLPDGLYCASYIMIMDAVWKKSKYSLRLLAASLIPLVAIVHELLQAAGLTRGTFDWGDLLCYSLPLLLYYLLTGALKKLRISYRRT